MNLATSKITACYRQIERRFGGVGDVPDSSVVDAVLSGARKQQHKQSYVPSH